jgi:hypothetical protein
MAPTEAIVHADHNYALIFELWKGRRWNSWCSDEDHVPNRDNSSFMSRVISGLERVVKTLNIKCIRWRVLNPLWKLLRRTLSAWPMVAGGTALKGAGRRQQLLEQKAARRHPWVACHPFTPAHEFWRTADQVCAEILIITFVLIPFKYVKSLSNIVVCIWFLRICICTRLCLWIVNKMTE